MFPKRTLEEMKYYKIPYNFRAESFEMFIHSQNEIKHSKYHSYIVPPASNTRVKRNSRNYQLPSAV